MAAAAALYGMMGVLDSLEDEGLDGRDGRGVEGVVGTGKATVANSMGDGGCEREGVTNSGWGGDFGGILGNGDSMG